VLAALALVLVLNGLSRVPTEGWSSPLVLVSCLFGVVCAVALVIVEKTRREPMLDLRLFGDALFASTNLTHVLATTGLMGMLFVVPLYLQQLRGLSALESGLTTVPQALGLLTVVPLAGWLYPRFGARALIVTGLAGSAVTAAMMGFTGLETDLWWVRAVLYGRGLAFGLALVPLQTAAFDRVSSADTGRASAIFNTARHVAASLGVALLASVLSMGAGLMGFQAAFAAATVLGIAGTLSAVRIPNGTARRTVGQEVTAVAA